MRISYASTYSAPRGRDYPPHNHPFWELVLYRSGRILAPVGEVVYEATPGLLLITPPGVTHAEQALTAYSNTFVHIENGEPDWPVAVSDADGRIAQIFAWIVQEIARNEAGSQAMLDALGAQLNVLLQRAVTASAPDETRQMVRAIEAYFEEHCGETLEMRRVASLFGVAPSTLRAYFAKHRGQSPTMVLHEIRLRRAMALLRGSDLNLEAVAAATGFYSASHLSRCIKKQTGQSPGRLR